MRLKLLRLTLRSDKPLEAAVAAAELRGFFATRFNEYALLHQHVADKLIYRYPRIQYKIVNGEAMILGIEEGVDVLKAIYDRYDELLLGDTRYTVLERELTIKEYDFGVSGELLSYKFVTPWLALSQRNYQRYVKLNRDDRRELLRRTLIGNILSASKSLGYFVTEQIKVSMGALHLKRCVLKGTPHIGFVGSFIVNFAIPDYMGLGKSVSRGFGTVIKLG